MNQTICEAIQNMHLLSFNYKNHKRVVEPHTHGISTTGNECMRCYQISGDSSSGKVPGWKMMTIDKITDLSLSQVKFSEPRPKYKKGDKHMTTIFCEL